MVIQNRNHVFTSSRNQALCSTPTCAGSGLVRSRVQFFEAPLETTPTPQPPPPPSPPNNTMNVSESRKEPYSQYHDDGTSSPPQQVQQDPAPTSPPTVRPLARLEPKRRYHDSFSNELPMIDERRQEDYPVARSACSQNTGRNSGSPLLESGIEYYSHGEYVKAEKAFMTALKLQEANMTEDDLTTALIMGNLGAVYLKQDKVEHAVQFLEASLGIKRNLGNQVTKADTYNNLGNCANLLGKFDDSIEYYRLALQELRQKRGRRSDVADALFNIGRLEILRENFTTANGVLGEALRMTKEVYGENHVYVAEASDLLGFVQVSLGLHEKSLISFTKGLEVYRNIHGPLHPDVANAIFNIGMLRESIKEYTDAWEAYSTAHDLYRRLGTPPEDPGFQTVRRSIAQVEKLIAQENQVRLMKKHNEAVKKKRRPKEKRSRTEKNDNSKVPVD